jgi:hypothetical protein
MNKKEVEAHLKMGPKHARFFINARKSGWKYVRVLASNDDRTCAVCASRNGRVFRVDRIPFPWHESCRCVACEVSEEAVEERNSVLRDLLLDGERWRDEHTRGVQAYAEAKKIDIKVAKAKLSKALGCPTELEIKAFGRKAIALRECVPLFI